jgi:predicted metal-dependent peptidase
MRESKCNYLTVYFHDTKCYHRENYTIHTINRIKVTKAGTSHVQVFEEVEKNETNIGLVIAFTDLETKFPPTTPKYPVIWAHPEGFSGEIEVPFGKKVLVRHAA